MQGQDHYKLNNDKSNNDAQDNSDAQRQQVVGQVIPQNQYNYPQHNAPQIQNPNPYQQQQPYPLQNQPQQMQQPQQQQYIHIPHGAVQQGQQLNPNQMSHLALTAYPPQKEQPSSRYSQTLNCRNCRRPVETLINHEVGNGSYVIGGLMAAVGLWLGCCLIPCMMDDCKDAVHYCPNCGTAIGRKKFLFE